MDKETQTHLFEPFYTTKGPGKGTGLGLATVYGIVKQSEGSIWVHSELGEGTTIKIYLPRVEDELDASHPATTELDIPRGTETILLVEDEPSVRKLVRHILQKQGYTVIEASTGLQALKVIEKHAGEVHLLLSDVVMPGMNGAELAAKLSKIRPKMKTLFLSGYSSDAIARHGHLNPDTSFLQKPFLESDLAVKVRAVIDKK
jgi:CheY-like chemotaxis protein